MILNFEMFVQVIEYFYGWKMLTYFYSWTGRKVLLCVAISQFSIVQLHF